MEINGLIRQENEFPQENEGKSIAGDTPKDVLIKSEANEHLWNQVQSSFNHYIEDLKNHSKNKK